MEPVFHNESIESSFGPISVDPVSTCLVFYNRVPKCGSSTMSWIIKNMQKTLKFDVIDVSKPLIKQFMNQSQQVSYWETKRGNAAAFFKVTQKSYEL